VGDQHPFRHRIFHYRRWLTLEVVIIIVAIALIFATIEISRLKIFPVITAQQDYIIAVEAAIISILLIEIISGIIIKWFSERGARVYGIYIRTIIRIVGYLVAVVVIISILASNPALAISIGTITGVIIGFASQNVTSNVLAASLIIATRTLRIGDTVTVAGNTGQIVDITLMYTVVENETVKVFVPNSMMVTTAVQKKKTV
jgi:small conductance mechanosensitive channel